MKMSRGEMREEEKKEVVEGRGGGIPWCIRMTMGRSSDVKMGQGEGRANRGGKDRSRLVTK